MNLLVTLDSNYVYPLCAMLRSLADNTKNTHFDIFVAYSSLTDSDFSIMESSLGDADFTVHRLKVDDGLFEKAPVLYRISKETYYRLLLGEILPEDVDKIIYIDPDTIVKGDMNLLYDTDMTGCIVAGCAHLYGSIQKANIKRLKMKPTSKYINAGVMLIDVRKWREKITLDDIFSFVTENYKKLFLADQDVLNVLFEDDIKLIDERIFNLDEKTYLYYRYRGRDKKINMKWVDDNAVIIHYNGSFKPWKGKKYIGKLGDYFERYRNFRN